MWFQFGRGLVGVSADIVGTWPRSARMDRAAFSSASTPPARSPGTAPGGAAGGGTRRRRGVLVRLLAGRRAKDQAPARAQAAPRDLRRADTHAGRGRAASSDGE